MTTNDPPARPTTEPPGRVGLVVLDVDGTLVDRDLSMPDQRVEALDRLRRAVPTVLSTGRTAPSITGLLDRFTLPGPHAICNGAALVHGPDDIELLAGLDGDVADEVAAELTRRGVAFANYLADGTIHATTPDPRFAAFTTLGEPEPWIGDRGDAPVLKVLSVLEQHEEGDLRDLAADRARVQRTGPSFLEWNAPTASKGAAVREVAARLEVDPARVVAVGDSENDVSMLEAAYWGVAVADSSPAAVAAADIQLGGDVADLFRQLVERIGGDADDR